MFTFVILRLVIIYYKIKSSSYKDVIKELREQLSFVSID